MSNAPKKSDGTNVSSVFSIDFADDNAIPGVTQLINPSMLAKKAGAKKAAPMSLAPDPEPAAAPAAAAAPPKKNTPEVDSDGGISISLEDSSPAVITSHQRATSPEPAFAPPPVDSPVTAFAPTSSANTQTVTSPLAGGTALGDLGVMIELQFEDQRGYHRFVRFKPHSASPAVWQEKFFAQMKLDLKKLALGSTFEEFDISQRFQLDLFGMNENQYVQIIREKENSVRIHVLLSKSPLTTHKALVMAKLFGATENTGKIEIAF